MKYQESHLYAHEVRMNGMEKILRSYGVAQWTIDEARGPRGGGTPTPLI